MTEPTPPEATRPLLKGFNLDLREEARQFFHRRIRVAGIGVILGIAFAGIGAFYVRLSEPSEGSNTVTSNPGGRSPASATNVWMSRDRTHAKAARGSSMSSALPVAWSISSRGGS